MLRPLEAADPSAGDASGLLVGERAGVLELRRRASPNAEAPVIAHAEPGFGDALGALPMPIREDVNGWKPSLSSESWQPDVALSTSAGAEFDFEDFGALDHRARL